MADVAKKVQPGAGGLSCVARQAILDAEQKIVAYELLYRSSGTATSAGVTDDTAATATVVINTLAELGLEAVVGPRDMYVNCSAGVLDLPLEELLPVERVVLEILETVEVTPALIARIQTLRAVGFRIAIDDYFLGDERAALARSADIIKVDLMAPQNQDLSAVAQALSGFSGILLAEKVEDVRQFEACRELGFHLFQGYFFCKPNVMTRKAARPDKMNVLTTLSEMQRADITLDEAVALIQRDLGVSYRLLQCLNSVVFALRRPVESLRQALVLLGMPRVKAWISIMALSTVGEKPSEVLRMAMVRAAMCQGVASKVEGIDRETMFTIGLFSMLDVLLDMELTDAVGQLPLGDTITGALLGQPCRERDVLEAVVAYERGAFEDITDSDLAAPMLSEQWLEAVAWAEKTAAALTG